MSEPEPHLLIAVGGLSGTGKSTLARALASELGTVVLRSDVVRKAHFNVAETTPLGPDAYVPEVTALIYAQLNEACAAALARGRCVIVDAVFQRPAERAEIEAVARAGCAAFVGLWLEAANDVRRERVAARTADASDATPKVADEQALRDSGVIAWYKIDASGHSDAVLANALAVVGKGRAPD